jgi:tetratricopeptide (TPR) repeat protein
MRRQRPRVNWFLIAVIVVLIAIVTYVDRFVLPTAASPFLPTPTATRDPESYATQAESLFNEGKLLQAIDTYLEAIRVNPGDPALYIALARVQIFAGKYDDALTDAENALLLNPDNSMAHAVRSWALIQKGDFQAADDSMNTALQLDPNNGPAHAYKAFLYGRMYETNEGPSVDPIQVAIEESNVAISLAPSNLEAHWARAYILLITGNYLEAIQQYQQAININGQIAEIHLELGTTYRALGVVSGDSSQTNNAIQEYNTANTYNPSDFRPELYSSRALAGIAEWDKAIQYAESAVRDAPTDPYLHGNWGFMLYKKFEWPAAMEQLSLALYGGSTDDGQAILPLPPTGNDTWSADDPWIASYYYVYALLLAQTGRCSDALPLTQTILDYFRADENAVYNAQEAQDLCAESSQSLPTPTP